MANTWSPIINGSHRGIGGGSQQPSVMPFNSTTSNQTTTPSLSSPRPSSLQSSLRSRAAAFIPITPPVATNTAAGKGVGNNKNSYRSRAAPQCSPTSSGGGGRGRPSSTPHNKSPTSVAYAHQGAPRTPRNAGNHHNTGGASSPAQGKKFKTEMCTNMLNNGWCRFGKDCHYAHSQNELAKHAPSAEDLMKDDRLLRPCVIMVMTGKCPYKHRCKNLHDPRALICPMVESEKEIIIPEHCTKAKRNGYTIPDALYHRNLNSIRQTNPLVSPFTWDNRRPSRSSTSTTAVNIDIEWQETYNHVCNSGPGINVFPKSSANVKPVSSSLHRAAKGRGGGGGNSSYSDIVNKNSPQPALGELQKLCIAMSMYDDDSHLSFIYAPTDCLFGQPCMILQKRCFKLLDIEQCEETTVSIDNIIQEVSLEVYNSGSFSNPAAFVCVHQLSFDSKGKRSCNLSLWFNAKITACSGSKAKKMSKKEEPWRLSDKSLFCLPSNDEFDKAITSASTPYVYMEPFDDLKAGHNLIKGILSHKVATILLSKGIVFAAEMVSCVTELRKQYTFIKADMKRWEWQKTTDLSHFGKLKEEQVQTMYSPSPAWSKATITSDIWESFVVNINDNPEDESSIIIPTKDRLSVFDSVMKADDMSILFPSEVPHMEPVESSSHGTSSSLSEATWREILKGEGDAWDKAIQAAEEANKKNGSSSPIMA